MVNKYLMVDDSMDKTIFDLLVEQRLEKIKATLLSKGHEYSADSDRLHNFYQSAKVLRCCPEKVALAFVTKHITSAIDIVEALNKFDDEMQKYHSALKPTNVTKEIVEEKLGDIINYFIILEIIIKDRYKSWQNIQKL